MRYFIVKEYADYSDEFTLQGFQLYESESEKILKEKILGGISDNFGDYPVELYFGTNEYQEYSSKEELLGELKFQEITKEDYDKLLILFPNTNKYSFGVTAIL